MRKLILALVMVISLGFTGCFHKKILCETVIEGAYWTCEKLGVADQRIRELLKERAEREASATKATTQETENPPLEELLDFYEEEVLVP